MLSFHNDRFYLQKKLVLIFYLGKKTMFCYTLFSKRHKFIHKTYHVLHNILRQWNKKDIFLELLIKKKNKKTNEGLTVPSFCNSDHLLAERPQEAS